MRITKRQLKRIIKEEKAKIIAEEKVRKIVREKLAEAYGAKGPARGKSNLLEFFGLFGGADDEKVKKLNRMVQGIAEMAQDVKNYVASGNNEKAANSRDGIVDGLTAYMKELEGSSDDDYKEHKNHKGTETARDVEVVRVIFAGDTREDAISEIGDAIKKIKSKM